MMFTSIIKLFLNKTVCTVAMHNINNIMHLLVYASIVVTMRPAVIVTTTAGMIVSSKSPTA